MQWTVPAACFAAICVLMITTWLVSLKLKDASIVDIIWGFGFVVVAWVARFVAHGNPDRQNVLVACATLWGLRLAGYLFWRNHGKGEDFRYRAMRKKFGDRFPIVSLYSVYALQGVLMFIVSQPLQLGQMTKKAVGVLAIVGVAFWIVGLAFETIGDSQLARFKKDPASAGMVMDKGLWAWTRHPNYFGDACVWVGLTLIAVDAGGVAWGSVIGGIAMIILLVRVSGVPMLEKTIGRRRPGYAEYVARTSSFIPRPPKRR
jgi:steroid 5-alpha reductase family enzyme